MAKPWDETPEDSWRIVAEMAEFFLERKLTNGPDLCVIFALFIEMHATHFPEDRIPMAETMMKLMQNVMTDNKGAN
jgi:hypothetical protein